MMDPEWWDRVEYGRFRLSEFRSHAAAVAKYLIRAREKDSPDFLGSAEAYDKWSLNDLARDDDTQLQLLKMALAASRLVDGDMVAMGGSGGVLADDPLADFKLRVAGFTSEQSLDAAIGTTVRKKHINWPSVANWNDLQAIREGLDSLPNKPGEPQPPPLNWTHPPVARSPRVILFPQGHEPVAYVENQPVRTLTDTQYNVVHALLRAGMRGLSLKQFKRDSGHPSARDILSRLRSESELWRSVISTAAKRGGSYRIY
jgi:hypothetical protein